MGIVSLRLMKFLIFQSQSDFILQYMLFTIDYVVSVHSY